MAVVRGGAVRPHVQAFVDEVERRFGITSFGTYAGHQPAKDRAVDCFGTREQMLAVAQWCTRDDVIDAYGIDHVIHDIDPGNTDPGEIWNREIARKWREMANRGGPTQNHYDHVHVSFEATAAAVPAPQEDDLTDEEHTRLENAERDSGLARQHAYNAQEGVHKIQDDMVIIKQALAAGAAGAPIDIDAIAKKAADELAKRLES